MLYYEIREINISNARLPTKRAAACFQVLRAIRFDIENVTVFMKRYC